MVHPPASPWAIKTCTQPVLSHQARKEKGPGMGKKKGMSLLINFNLKWKQMLLFAPLYWITSSSGLQSVCSAHQLNLTYQSAYMPNTKHS